MDDVSRQVGVNLRRLRRAQGLSLDLLAGRSGLDKSFLSRVENGKRQLERRKHLNAVAVALGCNISELLGGPPTLVGPGARATSDAVPALRRALHAYTIGHVETSGVRPMDDLKARAAALWTARRLCDYDTLWQLLPHLIDDLQGHIASGNEPREALRLMVEVSSAAAFALRGIGHADLAWIAADCCKMAAEELADPVAIGLAEFTRAQASVLGHGYGGALHIAEAAADRMRPALPKDADALRVYGTLLLTASWSAGIALKPERGDAYVTEALDVGDRVGDPPQIGDSWQTYFGPTNNVIWQMSIAVEAGDGGRVVELAGSANVEVIGSKSREAAYWTELGVGLSHVRGSEDRAIAALTTADVVAPQRTRNNPQVRAAVSRMLDDARRRATSRQLSRLAGRVGIALN
jgi:transcriptional regulator with XRE-family HTH domain